MKFYYTSSFSLYYNLGPVFHKLVLSIKFSQQLRAYIVSYETNVFSFPGVRPATLHATVARSVVAKDGERGGTERERKGMGAGRKEMWDSIGGLKSEKIGDNTEKESVICL